MSLRWWKTEKAEAKAPERQWPHAGDTVWVRLPCCDVNVHPAKTVTAEDDFLTMEAPGETHSEPMVVPPSTRKFALGWREGTDHKQVRVRLSRHETNADGVHQWHVRAVGKPQTVHRRQHYRAKWDAPIECEVPSIHGPAQGRIVDISAGGLRCEIQVRGEPKNPFFNVTFKVRGEPRTYQTEVAWWGEPVEDKVQIGLMFVGLDNKAFTELQHLVTKVEQQNRQNL